MQDKKKKEVETVPIDISYEAMLNMTYKDFRKMTFETVHEMLAKADPKKAFGLICAFPDLFGISGPVQKDGKFIYTVRVKDEV